MDPMSVVRTLWKHKAYVLPVLVVTLIAALLMLQFGPRSYKSTESYALVNPNIPTQAQLEANPALKAVNSDNPYLRASNPTLITGVVIARLNDGATADLIAGKGLSTDFTVTADAGGNGFVIDITGVGNTPSESLAVTSALAGILVNDLRSLQTVNGADETYLYTALQVASPNKATEQFSSRLRAVIAVIIAGLVLTIGAVSVARWRETSRTRREASAGERDPEQDGTVPQKEEIDTELDETAAEQDETIAEQDETVAVTASVPKKR